MVPQPQSQSSTALSQTHGSLFWHLQTCHDFHCPICNRLCDDRHAAAGEWWLIVDPERRMAVRAAL